MAKEWMLATRKEALKKQSSFKNPDSYIITKNRNEDGKFARGWKLVKLV